MDFFFRFFCVDAGRGREEGVEKKEQTVGEELQTLAKEVARVETVRSYAG